MPIDVGYDDYGYYDLDTGENVILEYDEYGRVYNSLTGEEVGGIVNAARDVLIGIFGRQGYPPTGYPRGSQYPSGQYPQGQYYPQQRQSSGGGAGITLSTNTLMLIVGGVILFMLGRRR